MPKTAWYIDSFGHSAGNAHILAQLKFKYLVLGRMHLDFLELMKNEKKIEFYWKPFGNKNSNKKILTHVLPLHYGFTQYIDFLGKDNYRFKENLKRNMDKYIINIKEACRGLRHNNIMFLYGDDFLFKDNNLFLNIDALIDAFNKHNLESYSKIRAQFGIRENINIFYSTPEKYFNAVKKELKEKNKKLSIYSNIDFYPLRTDCFWTGYFTSRPYLKGYIRKGSNIFYSLSKYFSYKRLLYENLDDNVIKNLNKFRAIVGLAQHHDAITGTSTQYVSEDYIFKLKDGIKKLEKDFSESINNKYEIKIGRICYNNYISDENDCSKEFLISNNSNDNEIQLGIYNPKFTNFSSGFKNLLINIEIQKSEYEYIIDGIKSDFFCIDDKSLDDEKLFKYNGKCFLNFFYKFIENEELVFITLKQTSEKINREKYNKFNNGEENIELIKNDAIIQNLIFFPKNFEFKLEYFNQDKNINKINFTYYDGMYYVNSLGCKDGAYIFSPYNRYPDEIKIDYKNSFYFKGNLGITFVTRNIMTSFTIFTIFYNPFFIKVEHIFDSIQDYYFLKRFSFSYSFVLKTNINNLDKDKKPIFYTDSNGLEMMKRTIDKFAYTEKRDSTTGGNFYPVTTSISIQDENNEENKNKVTIFNDRAQGGTGILPGSIILILQKMSYQDDKRGLMEGLYEKESMDSFNFKTTHLIVFGNSIFENKDDVNNNNKYMNQKTDLLNFIYNYFNVGTFIFRIQKENNTISTLELNKKVKENNDLQSNNKINKYITISPDIRANYEIINNNLIIGEFFRYNNFYFNKDNNYTEGNITEDNDAYSDETSINDSYSPILNITNNTNNTNSNYTPDSNITNKENNSNFTNDNNTNYNNKTTNYTNSTNDYNNEFNKTANSTDKYSNIYSNNDDNLEIDDDTDNIEFNKISNDSFGFISMNFYEEKGFKIYVDKTGINYKNKIKNITVDIDEIKNKLIPPYNLTLSLRNNEFLYIYFYLDN